MIAAGSLIKFLIQALLNPATLLLIGLAYTGGYFKGEASADRRCNAAALQSKIDALQLDLKSAAAAAKRFEAEAATNATFAEKNAKIVREIANDPKRPACRLSDADLKRVYAIR